MIRVNEEQVKAFAAFFREYQGAEPFDFCSLGEGLLFPPRDGPGVVDYFFFCTAHQFGFWHLHDDRYGGPMTAELDGKSYKGSDFVWRCATRAWQADPGCFAPSQLARMDDREHAALFEDDDGVVPLPMWEEHLQITKAYAAWHGEQQTSPCALLHVAHTEDASLASFLRRAGAIPGYREDPLRKKLLLLAVILENRPEHFLEVRDPDAYRPIIDYHLQRSALRTGLVTVTDAHLLKTLELRRRLPAEEEVAVRQATFNAVEQLVALSGVSVAAIDYFFFSNRTRCPEMTEPDCDACPVNGMCEHHRRLFQPVFRTTAY